MVKTNQIHVGHLVAVDDHPKIGGNVVDLAGDVLGGIFFFGGTHVQDHLPWNVNDGNIEKLNFDCVETVLICILSHVIQIDMIVRD